MASLRHIAIALVVLLLWCCHATHASRSIQDPDWWKKTVVYQIYPRSFQDSDGDGVGDLKGIKSRLGYLGYLGVETVWLSPVYKSPFKDFGYDISDHKDIDPVFGTLQDLDDLLEDMHNRGMYLIMDFIPNHTSDQHPWFLESVKGGEDNPYADWYCWHDGKVMEDGTRAPPNNWLSVFGHSAWQWHEGRQQYYLHQFVPEQPDLNYRNPAVRNAMEDVLRFWAERGVDGFRVDAIQTMFEVEDTSLDEPRSFREGVGPEEHQYLSHIYTNDLPEIHEVTQSWRDNVFDPIDKKTGKHTFMVMETYNPENPADAMKYYESGADMPFNFHFIFTNQSCGGACYQFLIDHWVNYMPKDKWPNFVMGNHDNRRVTTKKGIPYINALNILLLMLPGTPTTYYGEEIGMLDIDVTFQDTQDPWGLMAGPELYTKYSRDPERSPMQWTAKKNAGFSKADKTWLSVHPGYKTRNVKIQKDDEYGTSPVQVYRRAVKLRSEPSFYNNQLTYHVVTDNILSFFRGQPGQDVYLVALNLGSKTEVPDLRWAGYSQGKVVLNTGDFDEGEVELGSTVDLQSVTLEAGQGFVARLIPDRAQEEL